jgi:alkyldihydroxyacetonephosphate synthase
MASFKPFPIEITNIEGGILTKYPKENLVPVSESALKELKDCVSAIYLDQESRINASRDWWPITLKWATQNIVPQLPYCVAVVRSTQEVSDVLKICNAYKIPVTPIAGRSGVCGSAVPIKGGLSLDLSEFEGLKDLDEISLLAKFNPGTFGPNVDQLLAPYNLMFPHYPQSIDLSTVGGWLACRSAGQFSNRFGKVDQMVASIEVVLPDGNVVNLGTSGGRASQGPDLMELFLGSEGTLGVITSATLKVDKKPEYVKKRAFSFKTFSDALNAIRKTIQDYAPIAVLRLYDKKESERHFQLSKNVLIALDQGNPAIVNACFSVLEKHCEDAEILDESLVDHWLKTRNDVSALGNLIKQGIIVDTAEVSGPWMKLTTLYNDVINSLLKVEGIIYASAHASHSYKDGGCLYFTFAGYKEDSGWEDALYKNAWQAILDTVLKHNCQISHHHGIGLLKGPYLKQYLGKGFDLLKNIKHTIDPNNILNPGKLGLP